MYISWFESAEPDRSRFGGKGSSLIALKRAGFPVPGGFCIGVEGYRDLVDACGLAPILGRVDSARLAQDRLQAKEFCDSVIARIDSISLSPKLEEQLAEASNVLFSRPDLHVAVRSSAIAEDGQSASFSGMYTSYLNIPTLEGVRSAVSSCYLSVWQPWALQYRARIAPDRLADCMAVVVMEMVHADVAAVAFSVNPVTGASDEVLINASWGLGESVVGGRVSPDHVVARKADGLVLQYIPGNKDSQILPGPDGGVEEQSVPPALASCPCLSGDDIRTIVEFTKAAEEFFGGPQDVELAKADGDWKVLQSRAITGLRA